MGTAETALGVLHLFLDPGTEPSGAQPVPYVFLQAVVPLVGGYLEQVVVQRADVLVDGNLVVVEDDQQVGVQAAGVVETLEGQAARHRAVADDGDYVLLSAFHLRRDGHAERGRDRRRGMAGAESVVWAFVPAGETADSVILPVLLKGFATSRQDLMGVGLVADVPDNLVFRGVEYLVDGHGDFHGAEAGADVAGVLRTAGDDVFAQFSAQPFQLCSIQIPDLGGIVDGFEKRHLICGLWSASGRGRARESG